MASDTRLPVELCDGAVVPRWLTMRAQPDVVALLDCYQAAVGETRRELESRVRRVRPSRLDRRAIGLVRQVLDERFPPAPRDGADPREVRLAAFVEAADCADRDTVLARVGAALGLSPPQVERRLFADLPGERLVAGPGEPPCPAEVIELANSLLLRRLLLRAESLAVRVQGAAKAVLRGLRSSGLIADIRDDGGSTLLRLSGPLSVHRRTTIYGRALARFVACLAWAERWHMCARCVLDGASHRLLCTEKDPVLAKRDPPPRFDRRLEERFHRSFVKVARGWEIVRESKPMRSGTSFFIPDFLVHREGQPGEPILIEIVGFWTPAYLARKLLALRQARLGRYVLCVDEALGVGDGAIPGDACVVPFRRTVDAGVVVGVLERLHDSHPKAAVQRC